MDFWIGKKLTFSEVLPEPFQPEELCSMNFDI